MRSSRASVHYVHPDPDFPHRVKVYVSPNRLQMRTTIRYIEGYWKACDQTMGMVCSKVGKSRPRHIVARMFLNLADLRRQGVEIISHECTHAGMAWARLRRANLKDMPGEEVLCYAVGRLTKQVIRLGHMHGAWQ